MDNLKQRINIKDLEQQIKLKQVTISVLQKEIHELEQKILEEKTGFKKGDLVIDNNGQKGILQFGEGGMFWYWRRIKKDGSLYAGTTWCGSGERLRKVEE